MKLVGRSFGSSVGGSFLTAAPLSITSPSMNGGKEESFELGDNPTLNASVPMKGEGREGGSRKEGGFRPFPLFRLTCMTHLLPLFGRIGRSHHRKGKWEEVARKRMRSVSVEALSSVIALTVLSSTVQHPPFFLPQYVAFSTLASSWQCHPLLSSFSFGDEPLTRDSWSPLGLVTPPLPAMGRGGGKRLYIPSSQGKGEKGGGVETAAAGKEGKQSRIL